MLNYGLRLKEKIGSSIQAKQSFLLNQNEIENFDKSVRAVVNAYRVGGRLYIAGNGGSAADAQHLAAEFISKLARPRKPLPAEALTVDTSIITAIGNDFSYDEIFARQIEGKMRKEDIFLALTTSGQSKNILRALEQCRQMGITSILFAGKDGGKAKNFADHTVLATGMDTSEIQEMHIVLYHTLCGCVEEELFPS